MNKKIKQSKLQVKKITIQSLDREEQKKVNGGSDVFRTVTPVFCKP